MKKGLIIKLTIVLLLAGLWTAFFYIHETLPKPIRAATALIETPVAITSGLSYYLNLGIPVYETPWAIVISNLTFFVVVIYLADKLIRKISQNN